MSKFLELGKEVTGAIVEGYRESFFAYVKVENIPDAVLESIGRNLYNNKEMFNDYLRFVYEKEEGFDWLDSEVNSYDFIYELVDEEISKLDSYYWSDDAEQYIPRVSITGDAEEFLNNMEIKKDSPVAIVLDEKEKDYMIMYLANEKTLNIEHYNKSIDLEDAKVIEPLELGDVVGNIVNTYNKVLETLNRWDNSDLSEYLWEYVKNVEEFESIRECFVDKDENTASENYMVLINTMMKKLQELKDDEEELENFKNIKRSLASYQEGIIDNIPENLFNIALDFAMESIEVALKDKFVWSDNEYSWIPVNVENKFKVELEERLKKHLNIESFDLPGVLPEDNEYEILRRFIKKEIMECIDNEYDESFGHVELDYFWKEAERFMDGFLAEGNLKNLSREDISHLYTEAIDYKDEETMYQINVRLLRTYFIDILVARNSVDNKLDLIAVYYLMERNMDKLSPYIETMVNNGFTFDELERRIANFDEIFMKNEVKKELDNMFKSWISNK